MATTNYEIAKERRKFYHRDSEASGSRSNLESESRSKRHDNKKASSSCRPTTRLTHRADNDTKVVEHVIVSESNEEDDDDSDNEDADRLESERIMVPYDPSEWNSSHIASWISWCDRTFSIRPIDALPLPSTGKELLKLSLRDWQNIGGVTGGRILARHLGHLHLQATGVHTPDLLQENENSSTVSFSTLRLLVASMVNLKRFALNLNDPR